MLYLCFSAINADEIIGSDISRSPLVCNSASTIDGLVNWENWWAARRLCTLNRRLWKWGTTGVAYSSCWTDVYRKTSVEASCACWSGHACWPVWTMLWWENCRLSCKPGCINVPFVDSSSSAPKTFLFVLEPVSSAEICKIVDKCPAKSFFADPVSTNILKKINHVLAYYYYCFSPSLLSPSNSMRKLKSNKIRLLGSLTQNNVVGTKHWLTEWSIGPYHGGRDSCRSWCNYSTGSFHNSHIMHILHEWIPLERIFTTNNYNCYASWYCRNCKRS